jgi:hypothetical protein
VTQVLIQRLQALEAQVEAQRRRRQQLEARLREGAPAGPAEGSGGDC